VDVLAQVTTTPVMVLPHPDAMRASEHAVKDTLVVMAMTDHLTGDAVLVNYAARFTEPSGKLFLTHIEDEATFERYMGTISRIPSIDTENARKTILEQLLKEPKDYIRSCREVLEAEGLPLAVEEIVTKGHHLREFEKLVEKHEVDLLVFNTKDEDQLAMHGLAYPLAVEFRQIPLLLL
jgi:nucleotide-binding universal stress UspA family protein